MAHLDNRTTAGEKERLFGQISMKIIYFQGKLKDKNIGISEAD